MIPLSMQCAFDKSKTLLIFCLATLLHNPIGGAFADDADIRIMTQNVYEGTNFTEITSATTLPAFLGAVTLTRQNILATRPDVRAAAVAGEIVREQPDLVALQEVAILRSGLVPLTSPATPVGTVEMDQLALILAELDRLGHPYNPVAILPNLDAQAPSSLGTSVRITDRTVILARANHWPDGIRISNGQVQDYLAILALPTPVGVSIPNTRGWASVDVTVDGRSFRFMTTHLEQIQPYNKSQALEAVQSAIASSSLPVVFVGDFNIQANAPSDPTYATYQAFLAAGLVDAWETRHSGDPGVTCCQLPNVMNVTTNLNQRVDLVLLSGGIDVRDIHLIGNKSSDMVQGVWPSDHAGIVASLRIPGHHH